MIVQKHARGNSRLLLRIDGCVDAENQRQILKSLAAGRRLVLLALCAPYPVVRLSPDGRLQDVCKRHGVLLLFRFMVMMILG
jgi:hypothetical protein